ncbi:Rieske (2Fe-2S) protein [Pseudomonas jinjuensis]|uniref:3-phenylpropionate/trans-cinnamate dioxygenase ferredoxin subunit n=1 Tax=Pseudomonas jinjuensis TaxID=198616 RepID=A0A1H0ELT5_9PSED|nr:non-heme iron oxygenase ferredoxin subunit [Pseudomonas jinjuensis]SDN83332.1 3-phenylpropionate/trans-cinnamate dioxygenase ferredoxin subunit [Pseudomonas jinjuensis]
MTAFRFALNSADLPPGKSKAVDLDGQSVLLCNVAGEVFAVENRCTHQGAELEGGRIRNGMIACPLHGVLFDVRTGCGKGPLGRVPLRTFAVQVVDGRIEVAGQSAVETA